MKSSLASSSSQSSSQRLPELSCGFGSFVQWESSGKSSNSSSSSSVLITLPSSLDMVDEGGGGLAFGGLVVCQLSTCHLGRARPN